MTATTNTFYRRRWNPLTDPTLPLEDPDVGPWLVECNLFGMNWLPVRPFETDPVRESTWAVMAMDLESIFVVPTSQPDQMAAWLTPGYDNCEHAVDGALLRLSGGDNHIGPDCWPLPNVIPAVTLTDQASADRLIPSLLGVPARMRAVILRPREEVYLDEWLMAYVCTKCGHCGHDPSPLAGGWCCERCPYTVKLLGSIGWVIIESAYDRSGERWVDRFLWTTRRNCRSAGVPLWSGPPIDGEVVREWPAGVGVPGEEGRRR